MTDWSDLDKDPNLGVHGERDDLVIALRLYEAGDGSVDDLVERWNLQGDQETEFRRLIRVGWESGRWPERRQEERRTGASHGIVVRKQLKILAALPFVDDLLNDATDVALRSRLHGPSHWEQVARNGISLGFQSSADLNVVLAFALIHDAFRENDDDDPDHGTRAAAWAFEHTAVLGPGFSGASSGLLYAALRYHNEGALSSDATVGACYDADRLDLGRVGIRPDPAYFSTAVGRKLAEGDA